MPDTYMVTTLCGPPGGPREWDQTSVDELPGGSETSCENCLKIYARRVDQPEALASDVKWIQVSEDSAWHIIDRTYLAIKEEAAEGDEEEDEVIVGTAETETQA